MRRRAQALEAGRPRAYAATATGPQRLRDREAARNAGSLRLRDVELAVDSSDVSGRRASLTVRSSYGIRGVRGSFAATRRVTAVRTGKGWRVRSETGRRQRNPWEVGPVAERRSRHFVVLAPARPRHRRRRAHRCARERLRAHGRGAAPAAAAAALPRDRGRRHRRGPRAHGAHQRRRRPRRDLGLRGARDRRGAARHRGAIAAAVRRLAAVQRARRRRAAPRRHARADPRRARRRDLGADARVAARRRGPLRVRGPPGRRAAGAVRDGRASGAARRALTLAGLSRPGAIARLDGDAQEAAYAYASAAAFYIVARYGRKRYLELYDAFNDEDLPGHAGARVTAAAVRRTLGISMTRLERDLRRGSDARLALARRALTQIGLLHPRRIGR